ncbi:hypothetical protein QZH41_015593, partial [Actinostola sp. cb2023]
SFGNFTFLMDLFTDKDYTTRYKSKDYPISVQINDPVYVQYQVLSEKGDLNVFAEKCLATTTTRPTSSPSYVFLDEGCPRDDTMVYNYAINRKQNFTIKAFRFIADHPVVYLHCLLMVCHSSSNSSKCATGCIDKIRAKREIARDRALGRESSLYHLASGPLTLKKTNEDTKPSDKSLGVPLTVTVLSSAVGLLLLGCVVLLALLCRKKRQKRQKRQKRNTDFIPAELQAYDHPGVATEEDTSL